MKCLAVFLLILIGCAPHQHYHNRNAEPFAYISTPNIDVGAGNDEELSPQLTDVARAAALAKKHAAEDHLRQGGCLRASGCLPLPIDRAIPYVPDFRLAALEGASEMYAAVYRDEYAKERLRLESNDLRGGCIFTAFIYVFVRLVKAGLDDDL